MRAKSAVPVFLFVVVLISAIDVKSWCSCMYVTPDTPFIEIVFFGKIIKKSAAQNSVKYDVEISEIFKGLTNQKTVEVFHSSLGCGALMSENKEYLFMTSRDKNSGEIRLGGCAYSYENAHQQKQMLETLRWKKNPENKGGIIVGKVAPKLMYDEATFKPAGADKVFLENDAGEKLETAIGPDGFYKFTHLKEGNYKVYLDLPETLTTYGDANGYDWESSVRKGLKISGSNGQIADFRILVNGIISGNVTDENSLPVRSVDINLYQIDEKGEEFVIDAEKTDSQGNYCFKGLAAGNYFIRVGPEKEYLEPTSKNVQFPNTYFPNTTTRTNAETIKLEQAANLKDKNITLSSYKKRLVTGQVLMENNLPARNARISVQIKRTENKQIFRSGWYSWIKTDESGNFSFEAYENTEYLVHSYIGKITQEVVLNILYSSKCFTLPKNGEINPLKITLKKGDIECDEKKFGF